MCVCVCVCVCVQDGEPAAEEAEDEDEEQDVYGKIHADFSQGLVFKDQVYVLVRLGLGIFRFWL